MLSIANMMNSQDVGIDLGTANVRVYVRGQGIVLNEPSVVAVNKATGELLAVGDEARSMVGRAPGTIIVVRPLRDGVISNFREAERMLCFFLRKVIGKRLFFKPRVLVCMPSGITEVEQRALIEASEEAGAKRADLMEEPVAAAIGAGLDISAPYGNAVIDIGGGTSDIAVISLGGIVISRSITSAGDKLDEALIRYMRKVHGVLIGERTAEEIKVNIGSAVPRKDEFFMEVSGRSLGTGLPKTVTVGSNETVEAFQEPLGQLVDAVRNVLERTPPELTADITENGLCLTGGGALLSGLDKLLSEKTDLRCYVAEDAPSCVAIGAGLALDNISLISGERPRLDI
jgi:rod shape-determining protein MreB